MHDCQHTWSILYVHLYMTICSTHPYPEMKRNTGKNEQGKTFINIKGKYSTLVLLIRWLDQCRTISTGTLTIQFCMSCDLIVLLLHILLFKYLINSRLYILLIDPWFYFT